MKPIHWKYLQAHECSVLEQANFDHLGKPTTVRISHSELQRPLWFQLSSRGNWFWRTTGRAADSHGRGYLLVGELKEEKSNA